MANLTVNKTAHSFDRARLESLLSRRFFYAPAFEIYGGACAIFYGDVMTDLLPS